MEPTIMEGDYVLVNRWIGKPSKGNIVVITKENKFIVKRIREIKKSGYFVVGDNKKHSKDSRKFGLIKRNQIIGKVFYIIKERT